MTFSKEIIALIDALANRLGIVVDWTAENVMPYLTDLANRYITLTIWQNVLWAIVLIVGFILSFLLLRKGFKMEHEDDLNIKSWNSDIYIPCQVVGGILTAVFTLLNLIFIPMYIEDILTCVFIPEKIILDYLKTLIATTA